MRIKKTPNKNKNEIKIGDKFTVNYDMQPIHRRWVTTEIDEKSQKINDIYLEYMQKNQYHWYSFYTPKIGEIIEIVDLEKKLVPGNSSDSKLFTFKIGNDYYSSNWRSLKDLIK
jgi:hypothetical protein